MGTQSANAVRAKRAEQIDVIDIRRISGQVWEMDVINDRGERRENITVIPSDVYTNSMDSRYRGPRGVVDKYIQTLARERDEAREQLLDAIDERVERIEEEIDDLEEERLRCQQAADLLSQSQSPTGS